MIDPTHSPTWARALAATQQQFTADLESHGFTRVADEDRWQGDVEVVDLNGAPTVAEIEIEVGDGFPFDPPKVTDISMTSSRTWHHNRDWSLCLYSRRGVADRPWARVPELLQRIQDWFDNAAQGWPNDPPDLDLERYFDPHPLFATYGDLNQLMFKPVRAKLRGDHLHIDGTGTAPKRGASRGGRSFGWVGDLGELDSPVFDWPTVHAKLSDNAETVKRKVTESKYRFLALRYRRRQFEGCVVLVPSVDGKTISLRAADSAANDVSTRRLRAGDPDIVATLRGKKIAIVGLGAVGSFTADLLVRAGVGRFHLVDSDRLRPGNCIRHLLSYDHIGANKATAVKKYLDETGMLAPDAVQATETRLFPSLGADLIEWADVVVDATADDNVRGLLVHLHEEASQLGIESSVVTVAAHRSGGIIRSDRWPRSSASPPAPIPAHPEGETDLYEGGCGDPVSTTPAMAVVEAAALACRHTVDTLTEAPAMPSNIVQVLCPQPDAPYAGLRVLTEQ